MTTPELLQNYETCDRKGYYSRSWAPRKLDPTRMMQEAIRQALAAPDGDYGEIAGSAMMQLASDRGLDTTTHKVYQSVVHHACIADLIVTAIRKPNDPPWLTPDNMENWIPSAYISPAGDTLRRLLLVSHWSDERHASECRGWGTLGEQSVYGLPMQMIVVVIGQQRDGIRGSSPWASGFLHPANKMLRFRKRRNGSKTPGNVFNDSWSKVFREDHDEISRKTWLEAMLVDDVLNEVLFIEDIPVPPSPHLLRARQMAEAKLEKLYATRQTPAANLTGCDWPVVCPFRNLCHTLPEREPEEKYGFIQIERHTPVPKAYNPTSQRTAPGPCSPGPQSLPSPPEMQG